MVAVLQDESERVWDRLELPTSTPLMPDRAEEIEELAIYTVASCVHHTARCGASATCTQCLIEVLTTHAAEVERRVRADERKRLDLITEHVSFERRAKLLLEQLGQLLPTDVQGRLHLVTKYLTMSANRAVQLDRRRATPPAEEGKE